MIPQPQIRCVDFVESVSDWMEGALTDADRVALEQHLAICPHCTEYLDQLRLAAQVLRLRREDPPEAPPAAAREELLAMFRRQRGD